MGLQCWPLPGAVPQCLAADADAAALPSPAKKQIKGVMSGLSSDNHVMSFNEDF